MNLNNDILNAAYPVIIFSNETLKLLKMNTAGLNFFEYSGKKIHSLSIVDILGNIENTTLQNMLKNKDKNVGVLYRGKATIKTGTKISVEFQIVHNTNNNETILLLRDNIKEELMEKQIEKLKERAKESSILKKEFLNNISHEIRTPMNGIIGFADLLKSPDLTESTKNNYIELIDKSSLQLMNIMENLIEISSLSTKQVSTIEEETNANNLLDGILEFYTGSAEKKGISLSVKSYLSEKDRFFFADRDHIYKILQNLTDNAIKFTHRGSVTLGSYIEDNSIIFYVEDTGIGIDPENKEIVFECFSQEDSSFSRHYGGLGVGLTIAEKYAAILGGTLSFSSEKGKGSIFKLIIPYKGANAQTPIPDIAEKKEKPESEKSLKTILVAEDEGLNYLYLKILLEKYSYPLEVFHAKNGKDAIDKVLQNSSIDLIFMDVKMPIMDGIEATKKIKSFKPKLPIIIQSAYSSDIDKDSAMDAGCSDYLTKPIVKEKLYSALDKYLETVI